MESTWSTATTTHNISCTTFKVMIVKLDGYHVLVSQPTAAYFKLYWTSTDGEKHLFRLSYLYICMLYIILYMKNKKCNISANFLLNSSFPDSVWWSSLPNDNNGMIWKTAVKKNYLSQDYSYYCSGQSIIVRIPADCFFRNTSWHCASGHYPVVKDGVGSNQAPAWGMIWFSKMDSLSYQDLF